MMKKVLINGFILLMCAMLLTACGIFEPKPKVPEKMTVEYIGDEYVIYGMPMQEWNVECYLHWKDGTKEKTDNFVIVDEDRDLMPADSVKTFTVQSTEYDLSTTIDIVIPEYQHFPDTREDFCNKYYNLMKENGITRFVMEFDRNEFGIINSVDFKAGDGSYWYFLELSTFPYNPESQYFDRVKIETNVQYDVDEMELMKQLLIELTLPAETYSADEAYGLMTANDGELRAGNVDYLAFFTAESKIYFGPMYYLSADIVQEPCYVAE